MVKRIQMIKRYFGEEYFVMNIINIFAKCKLSEQCLGIQNKLAELEEGEHSRKRTISKANQEDLEQNNQK
jgi:hypothetical protein